MKSTFRFDGGEIQTLVRDLRTIERRALAWVDSDLPPCLQLVIEPGEDYGEGFASLMSNARVTWGTSVGNIEGVPDGGVSVIVPIDVLESVRDGDGVFFETDGNSLVLRTTRPGA